MLRAVLVVVGTLAANAAHAECTHATAPCPSDVSADTCQMTQQKLDEAYAKCLADQARLAAPKPTPTPTPTPAPAPTEAPAPSDAGRAQ